MLHTKNKFCMQIFLTNFKMSNIHGRIFVGGLGPDCDERLLEKTFEMFGEMTEVVLITDRETRESRGFGFISFKDQEAANEAISRMHGVELNGKCMTVKKAEGRQNNDRRGGRFGGDRFRDRGFNDRRGGRDSFNDRRGGRDRFESRGRRDHDEGRSFRDNRREYNDDFRGAGDRSDDDGYGGRGGRGGNFERGSRGGDYDRGYNGGRNGDRHPQRGYNDRSRSPIQRGYGGRGESPPPMRRRNMSPQPMGGGRGRSPNLIRRDLSPPPRQSRREYNDMYDDAPPQRTAYRGDSPGGFAGHRGGGRRGMSPQGRFDDRMASRSPPPSRGYNGGGSRGRPGRDMGGRRAGGDRGEGLL